MHPPDDEPDELPDDELDELLELLVELPDEELDALDELPEELVDDPEEPPDEASVPDEDGPPAPDPDAEPELEAPEPDELPDAVPDDAPDEPTDASCPALPASACSEGFPIPRIESHPTLLMPTSPRHATAVAHAFARRITRLLSPACRPRSFLRLASPAPDCSARAPTS
jgi:hypothetical protein